MSEVKLIVRQAVDARVTIPLRWAIVLAKESLESFGYIQI